MCVNEKYSSGTMRLQEAEMKKVEDLKYLGSTVLCIRECGKEMKEHVQRGWKWVEKSVRLHV